MTQAKLIIFPAIGAAALLGAIVAGTISTTPRQENLTALQAELDGLAASSATSLVATEDLEVERALSGTGADPSRVDADSDLIGDLLDTALTWDSDSSYREARESTMRIFELEEDSSFMSTFLPPAPVNIDAEGNEYPYIDAAGLNSHVAGADIDLLAVDGASYSYVALVSAQALSSDGRGAASGMASVFVTVDGDGMITELSGSASTSGVRSSP